MIDRPQDYQKAIQDFQKARQRADIQRLFAQLRGHSDHLFSYEDVRKKLHATETARRERKEVPLEAIVGSVGRYNDFTRNFLPRLDSDQGRWAGVKAEVLGLKGLDPIEVYQIDEVYFVKDGNHRVSIARQMDLPTIEAYVTKVQTRVTLNANVSPDELIIKAEYADFLDQTQLKYYFPDSEIELTAPGKYEKLFEDIQLHKYYMGEKLKREVELPEAVKDWYSTIYLRTTRFILEQDLLDGFQGRNEADLYLWMISWHKQLEQRLGWKLDNDSLAQGLRKELSLPKKNRVLSFGSIDKSVHNQQLFQNIMVAVTGTDADWLAVKQACLIAKREKTILYGLHGIGDGIDDDSFGAKKLIRREFFRICNEYEVEAQFAFARGYEQGDIVQEIAERSQWMDLVIAPLSYPPEGFSVTKLEGFEKLLRLSARPVLTVPVHAIVDKQNAEASTYLSDMKHPLFCFDGTPSNWIALSMLVYMAKTWGIRAKLLHVLPTGATESKVFEQAKDYLQEYDVEADFVLALANIVDAIKIELETSEHDLLITGSYAYRRWMSPLVSNNVLNQLLREVTLPVLVVK